MKKAQEINSVADIYSSSNLAMNDADYLPPIEVTDPLIEQDSDRNYQQLEEGKVPPYRAVFLIANAALGAGLLNFPEAYMKAGGVKTALIIEFILLGFIIGAFLILARCANRCQAPTYQDLIRRMLGPKFAGVVQVFVSIYFFGTAITYLIIIGDQLSPFFEFISGRSGVWYTNKKVLYTFFALLFLLPLCLPRKLKILSYTSFFGGIGAFFIAFIIVYKHFYGGYANHGETEYTQVKADWKSCLGAIPVICFGFQCHVSSVAVYAELKARNTRRFFMCALTAMMVCMVTYSISGSFGFMTFGAKTKADILENYDVDDALVNVARLAVVFILLSSFSIVTFCARTVIDGFIVKVRKYNEVEIENTERRRRIIETLAWFAFSLLLALVVPNIGAAISLIGGLAATFIFVFPGFCLLKTVNLSKVRLTTRDCILIVIAFLYIVVGFFIFGEVTTLSIQTDVKPRNIM